MCVHVYVCVYAVISEKDKRFIPKYICISLHIAMYVHPYFKSRGRLITQYKYMYNKS